MKQGKSFCLVFLRKKTWCYLQKRAGALTINCTHASAISTWLIQGTQFKEPKLLALHSKQCTSWSDLLLCILGNQSVTNSVILYSLAVYSPFCYSSFPRHNPIAQVLPILLLFIPQVLPILLLSNPHSPGVTYSVTLHSPGATHSITLQSPFPRCYPFCYSPFPRRYPFCYSSFPRCNSFHNSPFPRPYPFCYSPIPRGD